MSGVSVRVWVMWVALFAIVGCGSEGDGAPTTDTAAQRREHEAALVSLVNEQKLSSLAPVRLYPSGNSWAFFNDAEGLTQPQSQGATDFPLTGDIVISDGVEVPGYRICMTTGPFSIWRPRGEICPGEWMQNRGDARSTGASLFRLNWSARPQRVDNIPLDMAQALSPVRFFPVRDPVAGDIAFVQNGSGVQAFSADGSSRWKNDALGLGEIVDVVDLDSDGSLDVIYAVHAGINPQNSSATAPGVLFVLSAASGEVLWRHDFAGLEFGLNRYRTTIVNVDGAPSKSIFAAMTYGASVMRFDFDGGVRNGRLAWRGEALGYDSPDKAPLVLDLDADGRSEVVVDSFGVLYALDAASGAIKGSVTYANAPTFRGFLTARDLDGDGRPEIISASGSEYWKGYAVASWLNGQFVLRRTDMWEEGLQNAQFEVGFLDSLVPSAAGRPGLLVSVSNTLANRTQEELQLIDPITGNVTWRLAGHKLVHGMSLEGDHAFVATRTADAAAVLKVSATAVSAVATLPGARWMGSPALRDVGPTRRASYTGALQGLATSTGRASLAWVDAQDHLQQQLVDGLVDGVEVTSHPIDRQTLVFSDGRTGHRVSLGTAPVRWFSHSTRTFATPLVADIGGTGVREIIAPLHGGLSRFRVVNGAIVAPQEVFAIAPSQQPEAFRIPVLIDEPATSKRTIAGFETVVNAGVRQTFVSARGAEGELRWRRALNEGNWEASIAAVRGVGGAVHVALRDSRSTSLFDGANGNTVWSVTAVGECQRQMSSIDWNGDGIADVAVQGGPIAYIHDGATGAALWSQSLTGSYGAFSSFAKRAAGDMTLVLHNSGGLSVVAKEGLIKDAQIDTRRVESLPLVVGRRSAAASESVFQLTGTGRLRVFDAAGNFIEETQLDVPAVTLMAGAYVDGDDAVDLLVGTYSGELVAISGATLQVLWRVPLGAAVGTPVATDLDGDGRGEIVVVTSDGVLHIIRP